VDLILPMLSTLGSLSLSSASVGYDEKQLLCMVSSIDRVKFPELELQHALSCVKEIACKGKVRVIAE
jgi:hypothetical protein